MDVVPSQLSWKKFGQNSPASPTPIDAPMMTAPRRARSLSVRAFTMMKAMNAPIAAVSASAPTCAGKWIPELKITGDRADPMPAQITAAGRRIPNSTTVASHSKPVVAETVSLTVPWYDVYITPPTPRSRPTTRRSRSSPGTPRRLTCSRRSPTSAWPRWRGPRQSFEVVDQKRGDADEDQHEHRERLLCSVLMSKGPIFGRGSATTCVLRSQFHWNSTPSPRNASAKVASASGATEPERGNAMIVLSGTVAATPTTSRGGTTTRTG